MKIDELLLFLQMINFVCFLTDSLHIYNYLFSLFKNFILLFNMSSTGPVGWCMCVCVCVGGGVSLAGQLGTDA